MKKEQEILLYSKPIKVKELFKKYITNADYKLELSTRKDKKYMLIMPNGHKIHFGQMQYEDYTKHIDPIRRKLFQKRNHLWKNAEKYTPAWLSYYLLW